jgi:hypothetical protein
MVEEKTFIISACMKHASYIVEIIANFCHFNIFPSHFLPPSECSIFSSSSMYMLRDDGGETRAMNFEIDVNL